MLVSSSSIGLLDHITSSSPLEVNEYLKKLSPHQLNSEFLQSNFDGKKPLHIAIEKANLKIVEILLNFGAPIHEKIASQTLEDFAKGLVNQYPHQERQRIYALIKSRRKWQENIQKNLGIHFFQSIKAVEEAADRIQGAVKKQGVLFFSITGEGKSTLVNYLSGVDYQLIKEFGTHKPKPLTIEFVQTGNSTSSETTFPQVIPVENKPYVFVDMPGFEDTRTTTEEVCAAASICILTKQLSHIAAISFVCSWPSLTASKMLNYRTAARHIGAMMSQNPSIAENLVLAITKPDKGLSEYDVRERLRTLAETEEWSKQGSLTILKEENVDVERWKKHCIRITTEGILSRQGNIVIVDISSANTRLIFAKTLEVLNNKLKSSALYHFKNYSCFLGKFQMILEDFMNQYIEMTKTHNTLADRLKNHRLTIEKKKFEIIQLEMEKANISRKYLIPFDETSYWVAIQNIQQTIARLKSELNIHIQSRNMCEGKKWSYQNELIALEVGDDPAVRHACDSAKTCFNAVKQIGISSHFLNLSKNDVNNYREQQNKMERFRNLCPAEYSKLKEIWNTYIVVINDNISCRSQLTDTYQTFCSMGATVNSANSASMHAAEKVEIIFSESLKKLKQNQEAWFKVELQNFDACRALTEALHKKFRDDKVYLTAIASEKSARDKQMAHMNQVNADYHQLMTLLNNSIQAFNQAAQVIAKTQILKEQKLQILRNNIQNIQKDLGNIQQRIWDTQDLIQQQEVLAIQQNEKFKNEKAIHDTQAYIQFGIVKQIEENSSLIENILKELFIKQTEINEEISWCQLEWEVNQGLFDKIKKITQILELKNEVIDCFMSLNSH